MRIAALILLLHVQCFIFAFDVSVITHIGRTREWKPPPVLTGRTQRSKQKPPWTSNVKKAGPKNNLATAIFGFLFVANGYLIFRVLREKRPRLPQSMIDQPQSLT